MIYLKSAKTNYFFMLKILIDKLFYKNLLFRSLDLEQVIPAMLYVQKPFNCYATFISIYSKLALIVNLMHFINFKKSHFVKIFRKIFFKF